MTLKLTSKQCDINKEKNRNILKNERIEKKKGEWTEKNRKGKKIEMK